MKTGGGLLVSGPVWGWLQLNPGKSLSKDHSGNRLLTLLGLALTDGTVEESAPIESTRGNAAVAFAAMQAGSPNAYLRRQMLHQLHHYRQCDPAPTGALVLEDHGSAEQVTPNPLTGIQWRNYYHPLDPVSTSFIFYQPDENVPISDLAPEDNKFVLAHNGYWRSFQFHQDIHERIICQI